MTVHGLIAEVRAEMARLHSQLADVEERIQKLETRMMARFDRLEDSPWAMSPKRTSWALFEQRWAR